MAGISISGKASWLEGVAQTVDLDSAQQLRVLSLQVGLWAERNLPKADPLMLAAFEGLLDEENPDLLKWLTGQLEPPEALRKNPAFVVRPHDLLALLPSHGRNALCACSCGVKPSPSIQKFNLPFVFVCVCMLLCSESFLRDFKALMHVHLQNTLSIQPISYPHP